LRVIKIREPADGDGREREKKKIGVWS